MTEAKTYEKVVCERIGNKAHYHLITDGKVDKTVTHSAVPKWDRKQ